MSIPTVGTAGVAAPYRGVSNQVNKSTSGQTDTQSAFTLPSTSASESGASSAPTSLSSSGVSVVQLSSDQLAALQNIMREPDPAMVAAQNASKASGVIRDSSTGEFLGGSWPGAGMISIPNIGNDSRLSSRDASESDIVKFLAQDIEQTTGKPVTIQYYKPGDSNAPTWAQITAMISKTS